MQLLNALGLQLTDAAEAAPLLKHPLALGRRHMGNDAIIFADFQERRNALADRRAKLFSKCSATKKSRFGTPPDQDNERN
jgi:hypothetical protein